jgi:mRNA-degrading endonuclease toxin of MazEF toxin-antitoxin module
MIRGEIYLADLDVAGVRPVLIVSRDDLNRGSYLLVVPFTTAHLHRRSRLPNCVLFRAGQFGLSKDSVAQCEIMLSINQSQIQADSLGQLDDAAMRDIVKAIGFVIVADCEPQ